MTLCIKKDNFNVQNICLGKEIKLQNENQNINTIIRPLLYLYEKNLVRRFCFITDWVHVSKYVNFNKYIRFEIQNDDIINIVQQIEKKIKFNIPQNQTQHNIIDDELDSEIESDSESEDENEEKPVNVQQNVQEQITLNDSIENIPDDDYQSNYVFFRFKNTNSIILHPSKKSNLQEYELTKTENYKEIDRYYPSFNKQGNYKIVGKFLVNVNCSLSTIDGVSHNNIIYSIKSGELKYEKSYIKDNKLKAKSIFEDKIKIEI